MWTNNIQVSCSDILKQQTNVIVRSSTLIKNYALQAAVSKEENEGNIDKSLNCNKFSQNLLLDRYLQITQSLKKIMSESNTSKLNQAVGW